MVVIMLQYFAGHQEGYPSFVKNVKKIVVLGGAFFSAGNATPSAEANVMPIMHVSVQPEI